MQKATTQSRTVSSERLANRGLTLPVKLPQDFYQLRIYLVLDCKRSEMGAITMLLYGKDGKLALSGTTDMQPKEIPDTMGSVILRYFCERPTGKPTQIPKVKGEGEKR